MQAQTIIDPARASAVVPTSPSNQRELSAAESAASTGLEEENDYAPATPGDDDLGQQLILKRNEKVQPFRAWFDTAAYWTDNAANVSQGEIEDWFLTGGVNLAWQQRLRGRYYGDVYLGQRIYRYDELDALDYEDGQVSAGFLVLLPEVMNSIFHVHYGYQRITQGIDDDPIYQAHTLRVGLQKTFLINRLNSLYVNATAALALDTEPDILARHEYSTSVGYNLKITRELAFSLSYRLSYFDYYNLQGREDWYHNWGAGLTWQPCDFVELTASYNFGLNRSNLDVFEYEAQLAGPSVSLKVKF
ncbi:hypothetical protein [Verrucomicrobium spinosum]|uniref:hypothetical protein n=1 Tax=Verrucomicrobium spinosum TaxID=2736 RepID=UPI0002F1FF5B|nr:hypothetical protein [Verrucomicrobium spinosum]